MQSSAASCLVRLNYSLHAIDAHKFLAMKKENNNRCTQQVENEWEWTTRRRKELKSGMAPDWVVVVVDDVVIFIVVAFNRVVKTRIFEKNLGQNHNIYSAEVCLRVRYVAPNAYERREKKTWIRHNREKMSKTNKGKQNFSHSHAETRTQSKHVHRHRVTKRTEKICKTESRCCRRRRNNNDRMLINLFCRHLNLFSRFAASHVALSFFRLKKQQKWMNGSVRFVSIFVVCRIEQSISSIRAASWNDLERTSCCFSLPWSISFSATLVVANTNAVADCQFEHSHCHAYCARPNVEFEMFFLWTFFWLSKRKRNQQKKENERARERENKKELISRPWSVHQQYHHYESMDDNRNE